MKWYLFFEHYHLASCGGKTLTANSLNFKKVISTWSSPMGAAWKICTRFLSRQQFNEYITHWLVFECSWIKSLKCLSLLIEVQVSFTVKARAVFIPKFWWMMSLYESSEYHFSWYFFSLYDSCKAERIKNTLLLVNSAWDGINYNSIIKYQ